MPVVFRQAPQCFCHLVGLQFQRLVQVTTLGQFAHGAGADQGIDAPPGEHLNIGNGPRLDLERHLHGIAAFTHRRALSAGMVKGADILGISGHTEELLPNFTRSGKIVIRHVFPLSW